MGNYCFCKDDDDNSQYEGKQSYRRISYDEVMDFRSNINSIFINQQFQQGNLCLVQGKYKEALEKFITVAKLQPSYPEIQDLISLAIIQLRAQFIYEEGIILYNEEEYEEALKRFDYIENELYTDFKQCRALIEDCRNKTWQIQIAEQIQNEYERIQAEQFIRSCYALILMVRDQRKQPEQPRRDSSIEYRQVRANSQQFPKIEIQKEQPKFDERNIEKLEIFYICFKTPQCRTNGSITFKHAQCGTVAYLNVNGYISCQRNCKTYYIGEAIFNCSQRQVFERANNVNSNQEFIRDQRLYAQFIEDCLEKNQHTEIAKTDFRMRASAGMMGLLNYQ